MWISKSVVFILFKSHCGQNTYTITKGIYSKVMKLSYGSYGLHFYWQTPCTLHVKCCRYCYDVMFISVLAVIVTCPVGSWFTNKPWNPHWLLPLTVHYILNIIYIKVATRDVIAVRRLFYWMRFTYLQCFSLITIAVSEFCPIQSSL